MPLNCFTFTSASVLTLATLAKYKDSQKFAGRVVDTHHIGFFQIVALGVAY